MKKLIIILHILHQLFFINSFAKEIYIRMDYKVDDSIKNVKMGNIQWKPKTPQRHSTSAMFFIKGKIGETLVIKVYNSLLSVFLGSILQIGTTEFITGQNADWKIEPSNIFENVSKIEVKGKKSMQ